MITAAQARLPSKFRNDIDKIRTFLMEYAFEYFDFEEPTVQFLVARDTQKNFEEFFKYILNNNIKNDEACTLTLFFIPFYLLPK